MYALKLVIWKIKIRTTARVRGLSIAVIAVIENVCSPDCTTVGMLSILALHLTILGSGAGVVEVREGSKSNQRQVTQSFGNNEQTGCTKEGRHFN